VSKPSVDFFKKLIEVSGHAPEEIAYVGDRLDNDIRPAAEAGLFTIWIKRGPWGYIAHEPGAAALELDSLDQLSKGLKSAPDATTQMPRGLRHS
jgi:FMN phosphatase YigB (HAD superfamily)